MFHAPSANFLNRRVCQFLPPSQYSLLKANLTSQHETHMERKKENWSVVLSWAAFEEIEKQAKGSGMVSNTKHLSHRWVQQQNMTGPNISKSHQMSPALNPNPDLFSSLTSLVVPAYSFSHSYMTQGRSLQECSVTSRFTFLTASIPLPGHKWTSAPQLVLTHHFFF